MAVFGRRAHIWVLYLSKTIAEIWFKCFNTLPRPVLYDLFVFVDFVWYIVWEGPTPLKSDLLDISIYGPLGRQGKYNTGTSSYSRRQVLGVGGDSICARKGVYITVHSYADFNLSQVDGICVSVLGSQFLKNRDLIT